MPGNITFKTASADLNAGFFKVLDSVALVLKEFDKTLIDVEGHTDSDGNDNYNQQLSLQRANSVGTLPAVAWREQPAHRDVGCRREPAGRVQRHRRMASSRTAAWSSSCSPSPRLIVVESLKLETAALRPPLFHVALRLSFGFTPETIGTCQTA